MEFSKTANHATVAAGIRNRNAHSGDFGVETCKNAGFSQDPHHGDYSELLRVKTYTGVRLSRLSCPRAVSAGDAVTSCSPGVMRYFVNGVLGESLICHAANSCLCNAAVFAIVLAALFCALLFGAPMFCAQSSPDA